MWATSLQFHHRQHFHCIGIMFISSAKCSERTSFLRDSSLFHFGWIFGKLPKGLWPPPPSPPPTFFVREVLKSATKFSDWCDPPLFFRKFIVSTPLFPKVHRFFPSKLTKKSATKFFGSEMTTPPLGSFPKIHPKWSIECSLTILNITRIANAILCHS